MQMQLMQFKIIKNHLLSTKLHTNHPFPLTIGVPKETRPNLEISKTLR